MSDVKVKFDKRAVEARISSKWNSILPMISEEILNDCNEYCKMDTGALKMSSMLHSEIGGRSGAVGWSAGGVRGLSLAGTCQNAKLIWRTPYARRQYWEIRTAYKDVNPKASWKWCEVAKQAHESRWREQARRLMGV